MKVRFLIMHDLNINLKKSICISDGPVFTWYCLAQY